MPVTYYTEEEMMKFSNQTKRQINDLIKEIKRVRHDQCRMLGDNISCGDCDYNGWKTDRATCTSETMYFSK